MILEILMEEKSGRRGETRRIDLDVPPSPLPPRFPFYLHRARCGGRNGASDKYKPEDIPPDGMSLINLGVWMARRWGRQSVTGTYTIWPRFFTSTLGYPALSRVSRKKQTSKLDYARIVLLLILILILLIITVVVIIRWKQRWTRIIRNINFS